jgi:PKD repeat protein
MRRIGMKKIIFSLLTVVVLIFMAVPTGIPVVMGQGVGNETTTNQTATNVTIQSPLVADFDFDIPDCPLCEGIAFTDRSSGGVEPYTYDWDFGDGSNSTEQNPTHHYTDYGNYTVTLTVTDSASDVASKTETVVFGLVPEAGAEPESVISLAAGGSSWPRCNSGCTANDATIIAVWLVTDGNCSPGDGNAAELWARFDVQRAKGPWCIVSVMDVYLDDILAYDEYTTAVGDLPGKGQYDRKLGDVVWPCGAELEIRDVHVQWHTNNGGLCLWGECSGYVPSKCWDAGGPFYVHRPLVANFDVENICFCNNTTFTDTTTGGEKPYTYSWDFGGGYTYVGDNPIGLQNPVIHYNEYGNYTVTLNVTDSDCPANSDSQSYDVTVYPNPTVDAGENTGFCGGGSVELNGSATGGTPPYTYDWTGPENHPSTQNPTVSTPGTYTLTVTDANGCTGSDSVEVTVVEACEATAGNFSICAGTTVNDALFEPYIGCNGPECCEITGLNYSEVWDNFDNPGTYSYTVTCECDGGLCDPDTATGYVTVRDCSRPAGGGGGGCPTTKYLTVDWEGNNTTKPLYSNDKLAVDLLGPSPNDIHNLFLERGTHAPVVDETTYYLIVVRELEDIPHLPENLTAIVVFNITPADAVFNKDIFLTLGIDELPEGALNVTMAYYDDIDEVWETLEFEAGGPSGVAELILSAPINHFSIYGVLAELEPTPPQPAHFVATGLDIEPSVEKTVFVTRTGETVTITANIENNGGQEDTHTVELKIDGETVDTETVLLSAGLSHEVSFTVSGLDYGQHEVEVDELSDEFTTSRIIAWWLIILIIVAIGLIIWGVVWGRRRRKSQQEA